MSNKGKTYRAFGSIRENAPDKFLPSYKLFGKVRYGYQVRTIEEAERWLLNQQSAVEEKRLNQKLGIQEEKRKVVIEVLGGIAHVASAPDDVEVIIDDLD